LANEVVGFDLRFVAGQLPTETELAVLLEPRSSKHDREGKHCSIIFDGWGPVLEGLASGPMPAIAGLDPKLATLSKHDARGRNAAYRRSRLSLTEFGKAVLAGREDFCRHNPIRRWWGGTLLTNQRLWRWDRESGALVAP
jgi:hypothetical protein